MEIKRTIITALLSILSIYFFILIGFVSKQIFKDDIDEKTLIIMSIYFLQPLLTFWGLTRTPIDYNLILTPILYIVAVTITLVILIILSKKLFKDSKEQSIFIAASLIGNTGNLGIPLGIALFGEQSVPYMSIINIANIFFIYTIGIYFYAKDKFNFRQSLNSMVKIPILWFAIFALFYNYFELPINAQVDKILQMGAYATIVLQLIVFGVYLSKAKIKLNNYALNINVTLAKLFILPLVGLIVILVSGLDPYIASILMISLFLPLAVTNVNLSALYDCNPLDVTVVVFISSVLFLCLFYFDLEIIQYFFNVNLS